MPAEQAHIKLSVEFPCGGRLFGPASSTHRPWKWEMIDHLRLHGEVVICGGSYLLHSGSTAGPIHILQEQQL